MSTLNRAIAIAAEAHAGQFDKAGEAYILHPLRVMLRLDIENEQIVAVLHDVVEDCPGWSLNRLKAEGFSIEVLSALEAVTKREGEDYTAFILRAGQSELSRRVKLADLDDNCDLTRLANPTASDLMRVEKYRSAIAQLHAL